jgi:hypothetical protein
MKLWKPPGSVRIRLWNVLHFICFINVFYIWSCWNKSPRSFTSSIKHPTSKSCLQFHKKALLQYLLGNHSKFRHVRLEDYCCTFLFRVKMFNTSLWNIVSGTNSTGIIVSLMELGFKQKSKSCEHILQCHQGIFDKPIFLNSPFSMNNCLKSIPTYHWPSSTAAISVHNVSALTPENSNAFWNIWISESFFLIFDDFICSVICFPIQFAKKQLFSDLYAKKISE